MLWFLLHIIEWCRLLEISREIHNTSSDKNTAMIDMTHCFCVVLCGPICLLAAAAAGLFPICHLLNQNTAKSKCDV